MNHVRSLCKSIFVTLDISSSVSVSRLESKNCEKRIISLLTFIRRDVCVGDT